MAQNKIEEYLEKLPVQNDIVKDLNDAWKKRKLTENHLRERKLPTKFGQSEVVFDDTQYGDAAETGTVVFHMKSYNTYVAFEYYRSSYDGDTYDVHDIEFYKVNPVRKTIDYYEKV